MSSHAVEMPTGDQALQQLLAGNERYRQGQLGHPHQTIDRRHELTGGQAPFAIVLGCSDSRIPPEVVFDQGLGDIFVIRVAGNIIDDVVLGSIEYAAAHLGTPLVVVLGHSSCGAVTATVAGGELEGHLPSLAAAIQPAVTKAKEQPGELLPNAIKTNAQMMADQLRSSEPVMAELVQAGKLKVVAAYYELDSGKVAILP